MPRTSWPKTEAHAIQRRLNQVIAQQFDGVQARFIKRCDLTRDTASKWFGRSPRTPDTRTLARVAARCGVSLDWLVLGRGTMDWEAPVSRAAAKVRLFDAVERLLKRRGDDATLRAIYGLGNGPEALWRIVVDEAAELPSLIEVADGFREG